MKILRRKIAFITVILLIAGLFVNQAGFVSAVSFSDTNSHWAEEIIEKYTTKGYISGYADGSFKPDREISRAEFVSMVNKVFLIPNSNNGVKFSDVTSSDWFYSDVKNASADGYILGYNDNTFRPNNLVTRQEACVIIYRLLSLPPIIDDSQLTEFSDISTIAAWSKNSVISLIIEGIINGYADKTIRPNGKLTRAEALCMIDRTLNVTMPVIDQQDTIYVYFGVSGSTSIIDSLAKSKARGGLNFIWELDSHSCGSEIVNGNTGEKLEITAPYIEGEFSIFLYVTNTIGISSSKTIKIIATPPPLSGFPRLPDNSN